MTDNETTEIVSAAFGAKNRGRLLEQYFANLPQLTPSDAWEHVYKLLLWADQTTGLAHCYESDKTQPGKNWYGRALAFHDWLSTSLGVAPADLAEHIDWLFQRAARELAAEVLTKASKLSGAAVKQRERYESRGFPKPGEDPELVAIVREVLGDHLAGDPAPEQWRVLVQRIRQYLMLENKRKNLIGEGFEDVLAAVLRRVPGGDKLDLRTRRLIHELPGFNKQRKDDKPNKVDLAVIRRDSTSRTIVTAKWSLRADREKQFAAEFHEYVLAESDRQPFEYVFVTNEFDPARLMRACENLVGNAYMFTHVVHVNTDAIKATYGGAGDSETAKGRAAADSRRKVVGYIESGRLISLEAWIKRVLAT